MWSVKIHLDPFPPIVPFPLGPAMYLACHIRLSQSHPPPALQATADGGSISNSSLFDLMRSAFDAPRGENIPMTFLPSRCHRSRQMSLSLLFYALCRDNGVPQCVRSLSPQCSTTSPVPLYFFFVLIEVKRAAFSPPTSFPMDSSLFACP